MQLKLLAYCCACAAFWSSPAMAQQRTNAHPAEPRVEVPSMRYQSAFAGYQPFRDDKLAPWREVNEEAARTGGHAGIFGGGAHAGHGATQPVNDTPAPAATPPAMHGNDHQGMTK